MANTIFKLRRSSVAGKVPNTSSLSIGELAINLSDRKLYSSDGTYVFETGANLNSLNVSTNTTLNVVNVASNSTVNNVIITGGIYVNGEFGTAGQVLTTNGSTLYWGQSGGGNGILDVRQQYVGDGVTNTFVVNGGYRANDLSVYINGVLLRNGTDTNITDGGNFSLTTAPANGALIDVVGIGTLYANALSTVVSQQFTANGTANSFQITNGYTPSRIQVFLNGVKQIPGTDVIVTSGNTVNFTSMPANGYVVDVFGYNTDILYAIVANTDLTYAWTNTHSFGANVTLSSALIANGTAGLSSQVLTTNGTGIYWSSAGVNTAASYTWTNTHTFSSNLTVSSALIANGTAGLSSQVLTTNGSGVYWSSAGVNTAAQYTWSNTHTFSNTVSINQVSGNIIPSADNSYNLGNTSLRWANVYTGDLHLSNENTKGNDIDGTTGNWTIQEGNSELFIINNKNGKKFKFKLEEVE